MIRFIVGLVCVLCGLSAQSQKKIFIPEDLRGMDLQADTSKWSFKRSIETVDLIFMWERGFGDHGDRSRDSVQNHGPVPLIHQAEAKPTVLTERDIPITRPENYRYTPEEIALLKKQANEAYIKWMQLELEIAKHNLEQTANNYKEQ